MKKLLAILFAALLACALALPALAVEEDTIVGITEEGEIVTTVTPVPEDGIDLSAYARQGIVPITAPIAQEAKDLTPREAFRLIYEGYRAGKFTLWDILRAPFDILF